MAEKITATDGSKERVALDLLFAIHRAKAVELKTKDEILDLYAECLTAVKDKRGKGPTPKGRIARTG